MVLLVVWSWDGNIAKIAVQILLIKLLRSSCLAAVQFRHGNKSLVLLAFQV